MLLALITYYYGLMVYSGKCEVSEDAGLMEKEGRWWSWNTNTSSP